VLNWLFKAESENPNVKGKGMWLGATRSTGDRNNDFVWQSSKSEVKAFFNWNQGQPDNEVSISPTFYKQLFPTKVFLCLKYVLVIVVGRGLFK